MAEKTAISSSPVALVTGASRGIGAAIARAMAHVGMNVVINYSSDASETAAHELAQELEESGVETLVVQASVADFAEVRAMVSAIKERFGRIDVLVNNAGITRDGLLMRMKEDQFDSVIDTNLKGAFNCMRHVCPLMVKQRYGRIISISSVVGIAGNAGQVNYAASKAGIIGMTKAAAKELAGRNITVNAVAPGFIETAMTAVLGNEAQEAIVERIAAHRLGKPEDVAEAVAFFARPEASYITGQVISVDGGMSL